MVGADVVMMTSALLRHGPEHVATVETQLRAWLIEHEYESVEQLRGSASQATVEDPSAFERANYMRTLRSWATPGPDRRWAPAPCRTARADRPAGTGRRALLRTCAYVQALGMDHNDEIDALQAEFLKTLANPRRLRILHLLAAGPVGVASLAAELGISQPNVSQHLAVMRSAGVVEAERDGREVRYRLADPEIVVACGIVRASSSVGSGAWPA